MTDTVSYALRRYPLLAQVVRGFDVCSDEAGPPLWVCLPLLDDLCDAARHARAFLQETLGLDIPRHGKSIHAGEDFIHLLTGLRRIDEAIEWGGLDEGDRIGHGLALGIDPKHWASSTQIVSMPLGQRLWDLVWEYDLLSSGAISVGLDTSARLERELSEVSRQVFGASAPSPTALVTMHRDFGDSARTREVYRSRWVGTSDEELQVWHSYITDPDIYHREMQTTVVETEWDIERVIEIQAWLQQKVARRGVAIEINPTSNQFVGDLADLNAHPLWRLKPPGSEDEMSIPICIGSDDPVLLGSSLRDEYQRIADAMHAAGVTEELIVQWIERARETGIRRRFTVPRIYGERFDAVTDYSQRG